MSQPETADVSKMRIRRRVGCAAAAVLTLVVGWKGCEELRWAQFGHARFDPTLWKSDVATRGGDVDDARGKMVRSLVTRYRLVGMSRAQVRELFGQPDEPSQSPGGSRTRNDSPDSGKPGISAGWTYWLGMWSGLRMDEDSLDIEFDEFGIVSGWHIYQH